MGVSKLYTGTSYALDLNTHGKLLQPPKYSSGELSTILVCSFWLWHKHFSVRNTVNAQQDKQLSTVPTGRCKTERTGTESSEDCPAEPSWEGGGRMGSVPPLSVS